MSQMIMWKQFEKAQVCSESGMALSLGKKSS